jgi:hypothetical protein
VAGPQRSGRFKACQPERAEFDMAMAVAPRSEYFRQPSPSDNPYRLTIILPSGGLSHRSANGYDIFDAAEPERMKANDYISDSGLATSGHSIGTGCCGHRVLYSGTWHVIAIGLQCRGRRCGVAGVSDSSGGVTQAIFAAITGSQPLGIIYFPSGKFKIAPVPAAPLTGKVVKHVREH